MPQWIDAIAADELETGAATTVRAGDRQIALYRTEDGAWRAVDNHCPHEGYPLAQGTVRDGVLTCEWHNWKFRLCDGVCTFGGEDVEWFPVKVDGGRVWIDVAAKPTGDVVPELHASIRDAIDEMAWDQLSRAVQRLRVVGQTDSEILAFGCDWAARHAPYGFGHGLAATADLTALLELVPGDEDVVVTQALQLLAEPHVRRPERAFPEAERPGADVRGELRRRIEAEELGPAEALVRGAIESGMDRSALLSAFDSVVTDHFLDFGHSHIYLVKAEELLDAIGWESAHPVLTSLVANIHYATREDRLPYMRAYRRAMDGLESRLETWSSRAPDPAARVDVDAFLAAVLDGELGDALGAVAGALDAGVPPARIALLTGLAAAHRLLRFDAELELRDDVSEGWLTVTHAMTHADAVRELLLRRPSADALRGLFHSARFVQHLAPCDGAAPVTGNDLPASDELCRSSITDALTRPIFVVHHIKMAFAARRLEAALRSDVTLAARADASAFVAATHRFLESPQQERRVARAARVARNFVRNGKMQRKLLGY